MTSNSNPDNYTETIDRNIAYRIISRFFKKTSDGKYYDISEEELQGFNDSIRLLKSEQIKNSKNE